MEVYTNMSYDDTAAEHSSSNQTADENYYHALTTTHNEKPSPLQLRYNGPSKIDWESQNKRMKSLFIASLVVNIVLLVVVLAVVISSLALQSNGQSNNCNTLVPPNTNAVSVADDISQGGDEGGPITEPTVGVTSGSTPTTTMFNNWGKITTAYVPLWSTYCRSSPARNSSVVANEFACILWCEQNVLCTAAQIQKNNNNCLLIRSCSTPAQSAYYNTYVIQAFPDCAWKPSDSNGVWLVRDLGAIRTVEMVMFEDKTVGSAQTIEGTMAIFVGNSSDPATANTRNMRCASVCNLSSNNLNAGYLCNNVIGQFVLVYRGYDKTTNTDSGLHIIYGY